MDIKILNNAYPLPKYDDYVNSPDYLLFLLTEAVRYVELKTRGFQYPELLTKDEQKLIETWLIPELQKNKLLEIQKEKPAKKDISDKKKRLKLLKLKAKAAKAKMEMLKLKN